MSSGPSPHEHLSEEKLARAALTYLAEPGDPALGALLAICSPAEVLAAIKADMLPGTGPRCGDTPASRAALDRALGRWRARLPALPREERLADTSRDGIRLSCPGDADWPGALDQLGQARPYALWLRGHTDLRFACSRSVSMVGSRAATSYGGHVAGEIAADLGERGWTVVSGGRQEFDAVLGEPGEQVMAARPDEAAARESGVNSDLSDRPLGQEEGLCCLVCGEFGFGQNQAVQRWIEDVNAQWGDA